MTVRAFNAPASSALLLLLFSVPAGVGQASAGSLPAMAPTQGSSPAVTAPLAATGSDAGHTATGHPAQVACANGQLEIRAENSGLNQILRAVSRCTGMKITGRVSDQRVFGNYGPAAPASVLATLLDGTGSNMLLRETAQDQPAELILTPRTGGVTPPAAMSAGSEEAEDESQPPATMPQNPYRQGGPRPPMRPGMRPGMQPDMQQGGASSGFALSGPQSIPQPINNVNGSPSNTSPTASTYPTTNSVPLDSLATPSTTPPANGIVDAPNPPAAGSDTAAALNGAPKGTPGTTNIDPNDTSQTSTPGASNSTGPTLGRDQNPPSQTSTDLTPEQVFQQLQQRQQQQQQQQQQDSNPQ